MDWRSWERAAIACAEPARREYASYFNRYLWLSINIARMFIFKAGQLVRCLFPCASLYLAFEKHCLSSLFLPTLFEWLYHSIGCLLYIIINPYRFNAFDGEGAVNFLSGLISTTSSSICGRFSTSSTTLAFGRANPEVGSSLSAFERMIFIPGSWKRSGIVLASRCSMYTHWPPLPFFAKILAKCWPSLFSSGYNWQ